VTPQPLEQLKALKTRWVSFFPSPSWYLTVSPEIQQFVDVLRNEPVEVQETCKASLYDFFERHLVKGEISLGRGFQNMDADRKPIEIVVIHHTSNPPGLSRDRLSAIELIRLYGPYFANPKFEEDKHLKGKPIHSGHVRNGKQVFWPYHWMIRRNGRAERLLNDSEIGWHAGDWDVNCKSIAIALDNDYEFSRPSERELRGIAKVITNHYGYVTQPQIVGHREVNSKTVCPSNLFLGNANGKGWKHNLLKLCS
jgi:hypothetical protein